MAEGRKPCLMANCQIEDTTVGQLQPATRAKLGKAERFSVVVRRDRDPGSMKVVAHRHPPADPDAADQYFGQRDRVHKHLLGRAGQENISGRLVMWIDRIQMRDQDARVQHDHAGQPARSSAR